MHFACGISSSGFDDGQLFTGRSTFCLPVLSDDIWLYPTVLTPCQEQGADETGRGSIRKLNRSGGNISRWLNAVVSVLRRPSKLHTWFVFFPHNLLSLDTSSSSYLTSALWDVKYTLILPNCLLGRFWTGKGDLLGHGSRVWTVKKVLSETENHRVYIATIMGFFFFCTHHQPLLDSSLVFLWNCSKGLWHQNVLSWFWSLLSGVTRTQNQVKWIPLMQKHKGMNFHLHLGLSD